MRQWKLLIDRSLVRRLRAASIPLVGMHIALSPCMLTYAQTSPAESAKTHVIRSTVPADQARATLEFEVVANGDSGNKRENILSFSSMRSTASISMVSLIDPLQRVIWRKTPEELGIISRDVSSHPELGDAILLPELRDATPGRWHLSLERNLRSTGTVQILFSYRLLPRFQLSMTKLDASVAAGQPFLIELRPTDYGAPVVGLGKIELNVFDANGARVATYEAQENARSPTGIRISTESGVYISRVSLAKAGDYRLAAQQNFRGLYGPLSASAAMGLKTGLSGGAVALSDVRFETRHGPPGKTTATCINAVTFDFAVDVASAGIYVGNVALTAQGSTERRFVSASAQLPVGSGRISVKANATTLLALGAPLMQLSQVGLIRYGENGGLIAEARDVPLTTAQRYALAQICKE